MRRFARLLPLFGMLALVVTGCGSATGGAGGFLGAGGGFGASPSGGGSFLGGGSGGTSGLGGFGGSSGGLAGPGSSGPLAPSSTLPAPTASAAPVAQIAQQYGVRITGAGATPQTLETVSKGLQQYKPEQMQGLQQIDIPSVPSHSLNGLWQSSGGSAKITFWAHQQRNPPVLLHTVAHELGHHVTLFSRQQFGKAFDQALGNASSSIPRSYAGTNWREKVADNLAFVLLGSASELKPHSGWGLPQAAMALVQQEFAGRRPVI